MPETNIFTQLLETLTRTQELMQSIANKLEQIEGGGGGDGNATISDYEINKKYKRNTMLVDPEQETVYRVIPATYTSVALQTDITRGDLKLVGFENQIVTFPHNPSQAEINVLPNNSLVAVFSPTDSPYVPDH